MDAYLLTSFNCLDSAVEIYMYILLVTRLVL